MSPPSSQNAAPVKAKFQEALALSQQQRFTEAAAVCREILNIQPQHFDTLHLLGFMAFKANDPAGAVAWLEKALAINAGNATAFNTYGMALVAVQRPAEAVASYDRAIALKPAFAPAHNNRGAALKDLARYEEALQSYAAACSLDPHYPDPHWNAALCHLEMGNFEKGWQEYGWRWRIQKTGQQLRATDKPLWQGEDLRGKTILLYDEQGFGDAIHFCRYVKLVADLGARVILEVQKPLAALLERLDGAHAIIARGDIVPEFDFYCPLLNLPHVFNTTLETIPAPTRYIDSLPERLARWRGVLGERGRPRVGVAWSGNAVQGNDINRSMPLATLVKHLPADLDYISLQKDVRGSDRAVLQSAPQIRDFSAELKDFSDTAALCDLMDLIISVDTSAAHLAGAMGRPLWVMLSFSHCWRWLRKREDSPWYPSAKLYRQRAFADWDGVLADIGQDLQRKF